MVNDNVGYQVFMENLKAGASVPAALEAGHRAARDNKQADNDVLKAMGLDKIFDMFFGGKR